MTYLYLTLIAFHSLILVNIGNPMQSQYVQFRETSCFCVCAKLCLAFRDIFDVCASTLNRIRANLTWIKYSTLWTTFVFLGPIGQQRWRPDLWLVETFFYLSPTTPEHNLMKPDWSWSFFSSPEPKAQVSYCHSAPSVVRPSVRPSSVVRPSVNFHILNFFSRTA